MNWLRHVRICANCMSQTVFPLGKRRHDQDGPVVTAGGLGRRLEAKTGTLPLVRGAPVLSILDCLQRAAAVELPYECTWKDLRRRLQTHCYATLITPTEDALEHHDRKPGRPKEVQRLIYSMMGIDWKDLPVTRRTHKTGQCAKA